jgi:hypothetical protein
MTTSTSPEPQSDHRPLIRLDPAPPGVQLIGCTCGWRVRHGTKDPEKALAVHTAIAMVTT